MTKDDAKPRVGRPRGTPIKVWVNDQERAELTARAEQSGLSQSAYLRTAGLNHEIRSVYDLRAVADLGRVNGDLGRVAGLLKLWLADHGGFPAQRLEVEAMMKEFRILQTSLAHIMGQALRPYRRRS